MTGRYWTFLNYVALSSQHARIYVLFVEDRRFRGVPMYDKDKVTKRLMDAVVYGLKLEASSGQPFVWLCVVNNGVQLISSAALRLLGLGSDIDEKGFPTEVIFDVRLTDYELVGTSSGMLSQSFSPSFPPSS